MLLFIIIVVTNYYESFWLLLYAFATNRNPKIHFVHFARESSYMPKKNQTPRTYWFVTLDYRKWNSLNDNYIVHFVPNMQQFRPSDYLIAGQHSQHSQPWFLEFMWNFFFFQYTNAVCWMPYALCHMTNNPRFGSLRI